MRSLANGLSLSLSLPHSPFSSGTFAPFCESVWLQVTQQKTSNWAVTDLSTPQADERVLLFLCPISIQLHNFPHYGASLCGPTADDLHFMSDFVKRKRTHHL